MGSYMFFDSDAPVYATGFGLSMGFAISGLLVALVAELAYKTGNNRKAKMTDDDVRTTYSHDELIKLGDKSPLFKYTL